MSWILGGIYCGIIWLIFAKLKLMRLSLPLAIVLASVGPGMIITLLLCAQYLHPYTSSVVVLENIDPISPQLSRPGRVVDVPVNPNTPVRKDDVLFRVDEVPYQNAVDRAAAELNQAKQNVALSNASVSLAEATVKRAEADLKFAESNRDRQTKLRESNAASQEEFEQAATRFEQASSMLTEATQSLRQAQLGVEVSATKVREAELVLENAKYDLSNTTVVAPADGYVTNLQLRQGMMVDGTSKAVMTLVRNADSKNQPNIVAMFGQKSLPLIEPGQYAEVALAAYPGRILTGRVEAVIPTSGAGQLMASGELPDTIRPTQATAYAVKIRLDDDSVQLPGGAQGQAAVYTKHFQLAGIPIMFLIRTNSWLDYLK